MILGEKQVFEFECRSIKLKPLFGSWFKVVMLASLTCSGLPLPAIHSTHLFVCRLCDPSLMNPS